ncbi:MAG: hypothetical protein KDK36_01250 [Leptospiraceae bacterium]|nr:hypothetical protein [Leptospiraceae bacterium]
MEITESESIWKVLNLLFIKKKVSLLNKYGKSFPAEVDQGKDNTLILKSEGINQNSATRLLLAKNENKVFICESKVKGLSSDGGLIVTPSKITVRQETEEDKKEYVPPKLYVNGIISLSDITVFLGDDKIKELVKNHSRRLMHLFDIYKVYLSDKQDERIRLMKTFDQPIIILNREESKSVPDISVPHHEYVKSIKTERMPAEYKAEISVPIKYRHFIIIGYVQVFHKSRLDINSFNLVSLVASTIKKDLSDYKNYEESKELCRITAFTSTEITFLHSMNKHFSRIFRIGNQIIFNISTSKDVKITVRGIVKNISPLDKYFSVSCGFHNLTIEQLEKLEELVEMSELKTETD